MSKRETLSLLLQGLNLRQTLSLLLQGLNLRQQWIFKDEILGGVMRDWNEGHDIYESVC